MCPNLPDVRLYPIDEKKNVVRTIFSGFAHEKSNLPSFMSENFCSMAANWLSITEVTFLLTSSSFTFVSSNSSMYAEIRLIKEML